MTLAALNPQDLHPAQQLSAYEPLLIVLIASLALAIAAIALVVMLSRPRRADKQLKAAGAHSGASGKTAWRAKINEVLARHQRGELTRDESFDELARIARDYASTASGSDLSTQTLLELNRRTLPGTQRRGLELLRQTIAALYPPQFADDAINAQARDTSVEQACEWVSRLVERWR
ncbi:MULTISPECIES: hypothetical protein [Bifidobacterium]|jgi:hypothetical protein|uniref:Uncharacterized protein n=1 Tax=Bifidobacterium tibiigranuli TaxID=2172043 RepID=A0A5N6S176_9BIFI|nr:hypothetical protein [Bifidobacterium tibiigranuli]KAE8127188.1 hypothetical protein DDE84_09200 [Bifidobacterium tibiigranuli]KAE8127589.1 hypothetical protein DDF78_07885 [Bifidobacterium tibiigranuli]MCI1253591.1 hypothetical protein [Bifidobacterium tibiigranuli]